MNETALKIIESAIRRIRDGGFHSFSVREIADELGIKSASIYYHFSSKEVLGVAVAQHYTELFVEGLGSPCDHAKPVSYYIQAFQRALAEQQSACLCGILAAESGRIPESVREALAEFTEKNISWLKSAMEQQCPDWNDEKVEGTALAIFSALEGAMSFAAMGQQPAHLKRVGDWIEQLMD
jgi:TetR/AcrR family transcriptional repressor of nem operon